MTVTATITTGLLAWRWQLDGAPMRGTLLLHALFGGASGVAILLLWWRRLQQRRHSLSSPGRWYLALTVVAFLIITVAGHLGGYVSGVNTAVN
jgi:nitrate reductase gamma subunit